MVYHNTAIRAVVERVGLPSLKTAAQQPGLQSIYRFIVYYSDGRAHHSVATLFDLVTASHLKIDMIHVGFFNNQVLTRQVERDNYLKFRDVLNRTKFDTLHFPTRDLLHTSTIWCIERATGAFFHQLILTPHTSVKPYCMIVNAIDGYLPDAVREIPY